MRHGKGSFFDIDGSKYDGAYFKGNRQGFGNLMQANGDEYHGKFMNN